MLTNVLILLVVVTVIAVVVNAVGSSKGGVPDTIEGEKKDQATLEVSERMEQNSLGTLSDRAVAALQYQRLKNSFEENCMRDPESAEMITNRVRGNFERMAKTLATIGTRLNPEDVPTTTDKYELPPGWGLEGD